MHAGCESFFLPAISGRKETVGKTSESEKGSPFYIAAKIGIHKTWLVTTNGKAGLVFAARREGGASLLVDANHEQPHNMM